MRSVGVGNQIVVYYESKKRELQRRPIFEYRYDERVKNGKEESVIYTPLRHWENCLFLCYHVVYYESIKRDLKIVKILLVIINR